MNENNIDEDVVSNELDAANEYEEDDIQDNMDSFDNGKYRVVGQVKRNKILC